MIHSSRVVEDAVTEWGKVKVTAMHSQSRYHDSHA